MKIVEILNNTGFGKCDCEGIHSMMAIVIAFCPILDTWNFPSVFIFNVFSQPQFFIFVPVQFLHNIDQLPVFTQTTGNSTYSRSYGLDNVFQNFFGFARFVWLMTPDLASSSTLCLYCSSPSFPYFEETKSKAVISFFSILIALLSSVLFE